MNYRLPCYLLLGLACGCRIGGESHPETCVDFQPPTITSFSLLSDTLTVSDSLVPADYYEYDGVTYDTLPAEWTADSTQNVREVYLDAQSPARDTIALQWWQGSGFLLRAAHDSAWGPYRLPSAGRYTITGLVVSYVKSRCDNFYTGIEETEWVYTMTLDQLRQVGLERSTFAIVHTFSADSVTS